VLTAEAPFCFLICSHPAGTSTPINHVCLNDAVHLVTRVCLNDAVHLGTRVCLDDAVRCLLSMFWCTGACKESAKANAAVLRSAHHLCGGVCCNVMCLDWPRPYTYTIHDRICSDFPAKMKFTVCLYHI